MILDISEPASRLRGIVSRFLSRLGFKDDSFILILAVIIGVITAAAAVGFHQLINQIRNSLYQNAGENFLYGRGMVLLIFFPAAGGLAVGLISQYVFRAREGHGIVDVVESVVRTSGFQRPLVALEKIITSALTIGTGGSAGAEGPIVQIGAGIASGVGQLFRVARQHMPVLIGCGSAAGIGAIFNAPFGGVLFTLEVILQDFSIRAFTPVVVASVVAQVTELLLFQLMHESGQFHSIFHVSHAVVENHPALGWGQVGNFVLLGIVCGLAGLLLTRLMILFEQESHKIHFPKVLKPALGGAVVGVMGIFYIEIFGHYMLHIPKPVPFDQYPMPAFFGDGYGFIENLLTPNYDAYTGGHHRLLLLIASLCLLKIIATCFTLGSGGSGGIIAPSLFIGACAGAVFGAVLKNSGWFPYVEPEVYALVGMGAVLTAVVHAPMASILIVFEVTQDYKVMVPAMLACIIATSVARLLYRDSIYTATLRQRGIRSGGMADFTLLRRMNVEQVGLEPATIVHLNDPFQKILDLTITTGVSNFVVVDQAGDYAGMVVDDDIKTALLDREAIPLLVIKDIARTDIEPARNSDDLGMALDAFSRHDVNHLPVTMTSRPLHVIGLLSRSGLMRRYQQGLSEPG